MDNELKELARIDMIAAMQIELQNNQEFIDTTPIYRNTYRTTKIEVLRAIVRNHILRQFLHLPPEVRTVENLKKLNGMSDEFKILVYNTGATSYAYQVRYEAEKELFLDYAHIQNEDTDYFLDQLLLKEPVEEKSKTKEVMRFLFKILKVIGKTGEIVYYSIPWLIAGLWLVFIIGITIRAIINPEPTTVKTDSIITTSNIAEGNSDNQKRSLDVQIEDHSDQAGFGNAGMSGNDAVADNPDSTTIDNTLDTSSSTAPYESVKSDDYSFEEDTSYTSTVPLVAEEPVEEIVPEEPEIMSTDIPEDTFTIGLTKEQVKEVMGSPDSDLGSTWNYEYSMIQFDRDGLVNGWSNISNNLKAYMGNKKEHASTFTINSTEQDVLDAMGTPRSVIGTMWSYEYSMVRFDSNKLVEGWSNISDNLNVSIGSAKKNAMPFTTYSTKQEVINAMGTPTSVIGTTWSYEYSTVRFDNNDQVISWSDISHNLKVQ